MAAILLPIGNAQNRARGICALAEGVIRRNAIRIGGLRCAHPPYALGSQRPPRRGTAFGNGLMPERLLQCVGAIAK
jgi:hypothetical protein